MERVVVPHVLYTNVHFVSALEEIACDNPNLYNMV